MSARTWARTADKARLGQTLAGLHSDYILFLLDESGGIPDAVMATAENTPACRKAVTMLSPAARMEIGIPVASAEIFAIASEKRRRDSSSS